MAGNGTIKEIHITDKDADVDLVTDATLNDDTELKYSMAANEDVHFEFWIFAKWGAGGIQVAVNGPAGFSNLHYHINIDKSGTTKVASTIATAYDTAAADTSAGEGMIRIVGHVHNGATAGTLVLRWCQNSSNAANTTIEQGSTLKIIRY